jgi:hypothetical protein
MTFPGRVAHYFQYIEDDIQTYVSDTLLSGPRIITPNYRFSQHKKLKIKT